MDGTKHTILEAVKKTNKYKYYRGEKRFDQECEELGKKQIKQEQNG